MIILLEKLHKSGLFLEITFTILWLFCICFKLVCFLHNVQDSLLFFAIKCVNSHLLNLTYFQSGHVHIPDLGPLNLCDKAWNNYITTDVCVITLNVVTYLASFCFSLSRCVNYEPDCQQPSRIHLMCLPFPPGTQDRSVSEESYFMSDGLHLSEYVLCIALKWEAAHH